MNQDFCVLWQALGHGLEATAVQASPFVVLAVLSGAKKVDQLLEHRVADHGVAADKVDIGAPGDLKENQQDDPHANDDACAPREDKGGHGACDHPRQYRLQEAVLMTGDKPD